MAPEPGREARLVLACARAELDEPTRARIAEGLAAPIDWELVAAIAMRHGLAPLVHRHLGNRADIPKPVAAALWARAESVRRRNSAMLGEMKRIVAALDSRGVLVIPYKGPTLALMTLGDVALRESGDLDFIVARSAASLARAALEPLGYATLHGLDPAREELWIRSPRLYELPMANPARDMLVELQWRADAATDFPPVDDSRWWAGLPRIALEETAAIAMPPEHLLVCLLVHGSKHAWSNLGWLVDIAEIARRGGLDWEQVTALAREHRVVRRASLGLELARALLDAPLPREAAAFVDGAGVARIARLAIPHILSPRYRAPSIAAALRFQLELCDDAGQRARLLARTALAPSPGDWASCRLPRPLFFLYWVIRPFRLFAKYVLRIRTREAALPPRLEDDDGHGVGEIQAAVARPHRQP